MPTAPLRPCSGGCGRLVERGRCTACRAARDAMAGTAAQRGYDAHWIRFRPQFLAALTDAGILPVCGAALPTGPHTQDSQCKADGVFTYTSSDRSSLHFDHEPRLLAHERRSPWIVCDVNRVQLLCDACHASKTAREERGAVMAGRG